MAFDEKLAARVRKLLADRSDVTERLMFGGLTFMARAQEGCPGLHREVTGVWAEWAPELAWSVSTCYRASASARPARPGMPSLR